MANHVSFLREELLKLPSFPRKALESEFGLHKGQFGKVITSALNFDLILGKI